MMMRALVLLAMTSALSANAMQPRTIAGTWAVKADAVEKQTDSGGSWSRAAITGTLVIERNGDVLTGKWIGPKGDEWPLSGRVDLAKFAITTGLRDIPVTIDGQATKARFRWSFRGENDHDTLRGTMVLDREQEESDRLQPFTATRVK